jgi:ribosomal protein L16 Arg81 hydroxylase
VGSAHGNPAQFAAGVGIVVRHPEHQCPSSGELGRALAVDVPGEQRVLLFATPEASHGFSWHYDPEDVFIVQAAGDKEYYFRKNTVVPAPQRHGQPDFGAYASETSPMMSCRLVAGDFLYIPRGWWHMAHAHADSLSISIGVFPSGEKPSRGGSAVQRY